MILFLIAESLVVKVLQNMLLKLFNVVFPHQTTPYLHASFLYQTLNQKFYSKWTFNLRNRRFCALHWNSNSLNIKESNFVKSHFDFKNFFFRSYRLGYFGQYLIKRFKVFIPFRGTVISFFAYGS